MTDTTETPPILSLDDFAAAVGSDFALQADGQDQHIRLVEAQALADSGRVGGSFRLAFAGDGALVLPQSIYTLRRGEAVYEIFLVPIGRDERGTIYEAIFY